MRSAKLDPDSPSLTEHIKEFVEQGHINQITPAEFDELQEILISLQLNLLNCVKRKLAGSRMC